MKEFCCKDCKDNDTARGSREKGMGSKFNSWIKGPKELEWELTLILKTKCISPLTSKEVKEVRYEGPHISHK